MERKKIKIKKEIKAIFVSSTIQQNFGENVNGHGFVEWNIEDLSYKFHEVENKYPFYQFRIKSLDDLENNTEIITNLK